MPASKTAAKTPKKKTKSDIDPDTGLSKKDLDVLREKLNEEREGVLKRLNRHTEQASGGDDMPADEVDQASLVTDQAYLLKLADKERKLLAQIDHALRKLDSGEYGICEGTGEPIGKKRLMARPWTRHSIAYKEQLELEQKGVGRR
ncbi:MAG: TraR/DksA C4-type zinc finger protein [Chrysiogenetes bacterium]|nr:TraR/DksA C4-type zinc finger protein [Chrysiogenetes bacterium]